MTVRHEEDQRAVNRWAALPIQHQSWAEKKCLATIPIHKLASIGPLLKELKIQSAQPSRKRGKPLRQSISLF